MRNELRNVNQGVSWLDRFFYGRIPAVAAAKFSVVPLAFLFFWVTANDWCQSVGGSLSLSLSRTPANKKKEEHEDEERANGDEKTDERAVRLITVTATGGGAIDYGDIIVPNWPARWKTSKEI